MDFDPHYPIPVCERVAIDKYLDRESKCAAVRGYSDLYVNVRRRQIALHRILQNSRSENFDAFIPYLAMNYFDRFMSRHDLLNIEANWIVDVDLLAISCLSLAWKMRSNSFNLPHFLTERKISLKKKNIMVAELRILNALDWRMRSITAFCFAQLLFDVCKPQRGLRRQTISQIIIETQDDIRLATFKPSVLSASALLAAFSYLYRRRYQAYEQKLMSLEFIDKMELLRCVALVKEMCAKKQLWMETAEMEIMEGPRLQIQAGVPRPVQPVQPSSSETMVMQPMEGSSDSHRPGKEPAEEQPEPQPVSEIQPAEESPTMNFGLKWVTDNELDSLLDAPPGLAISDAAPYCLGLLSCNNQNNRCTVL